MEINKCPNCKNPIEIRYFDIVQTHPDGSEKLRGVDQTWKCYRCGWGLVKRLPKEEMLYERIR